MFGDGSTRRDYTYVDDIVDGIRAAMEYRENPYEVVNLGNNHTVSLAEMISVLEDVLRRAVRIERLPAQPGDVPQTWANVAKARRSLAYHPATEFRDGIAQFAAWLNDGTRHVA